MLVANKIDIVETPGRKRVNVRDAMIYAQTHGMKFYSASAKTGEQCETLCIEMVESLWKQNLKNP